MPPCREMFAPALRCGCISYCSWPAMVVWEDVSDAFAGGSASLQIRGTSGAKVLPRICRQYYNTANVVLWPITLSTFLECSLEL